MDDLRVEIAARERRDLEGAEAPRPDIVQMLNAHEFVRVRGIARSRSPHGITELMQWTDDFAMSAHPLGDFLTYVVGADASGVKLYCALGKATDVIHLMRGAFPGIALESTGVGRLGVHLGRNFANVGMITGVPGVLEISDRSDLQCGSRFRFIERLIRAMHGTTWGYVVRAFPKARRDAESEREVLIDRIAEVASQSKQNVQRSTQSSSAKTNRKSELQSETIGGEIVNKLAEYAVELLETDLERVGKAVATGYWQVAVYYGTEKQHDLKRLGALLAGGLSGTASTHVPIRVHICAKGTQRDDPRFYSHLNSNELSHLTRLPADESPGYTVTERALFDVDVDHGDAPALTIGRVIWEGQAFENEYKLPVADIARHAMIVEVNGRGKTTSVFGLLLQLWRESKTPFLVIEPAKHEYRVLSGKGSGGSVGEIPELRVYTVGNESIAPFRLNPFEFDLPSRPGRASVLEHIDTLKAVFNAAFVLYAPMPYVLETALHEVYEDKGWNLATGTNVRIPEESWNSLWKYPIFPTLSDLYQKVEAVTARLGYETRVEQDVIAGLKARIGAMRLGSKGLVLDTQRGIPIAELLEIPTVIELESIGSDDEKTFLMGLLLSRLYQYRRQEAPDRKAVPSLQHVLVIEEAHRLLKHVNTQVDTETSNLRAQAIETFVNILSEIRHYGQGVVVAEQVPSKLTPDVLKNTNFKLVHRLVAHDDRQLLGGSMAMDEDQERHLARLRTGEAVAYAEGDDHPCLLQIKNRRTDGAKPKQSSVIGITEEGRKYIRLDRCLAVTDLDRYGVKATHFSAPEVISYQWVQSALGKNSSARTWATLILRILFARASVLDVLQKLRDAISLSPGHLAAKQYSDALIIVLVFGAAQSLEERRVEASWAFPLADAMRHALTVGLIALGKSEDLSKAATDLDRFARSYEANRASERGPFPGCEACKSVCLYRPEVSRLLTSKEVGRVRDVLTTPMLTTTPDRYSELAKVLGTVTHQWVGGVGTDTRDIGYCAGLTAAATLRMDQGEQANFGRELAARLIV